MNMQKLKNYALVLLTLVLVITCYNIYQNNLEYKRQYQTFVNHFYFSINDAISSIDNLVNYPNGNVDVNLSRLKERLQKVDYILFYGSFFVDREIYYYKYFEDMQFMINGLHLTVNNRAPVEVAPFGEDGIVDEEEILYLQLMKNDLEQILNGLYSEETRQENPHITIKEFNRIVTPIVTKSISEMVSQHRYKNEVK